MAEKDRATRAKELISEEVAGLEKSYKEHHGDHPAKPTDVDYKRGKIDGLRQAGELLGEGKD